MSAITNSLRAMVRAVPESWEARLGLVEALVNEGALEEATQVLHEVTELPADLNERVKCGRAYGLLNPESGLQVIDGILAEDVTHARAHLEKAKIFWRKGDFENAQKHYFTAITFDASLTDGVFADELTHAKSSPPSTKTVTEQPVETVTEQPVEVVQQPRVVEQAEPTHYEPVNRDQVYYPVPGEFPVQTLREALGMPPIRPLVNPDTIPEHPELEYVEQPVYQEVEYTPEEVFYDQLNNVYVHPAVEEEVVYDYQQPDDSIFEQALTPDDIYVGALITDTGEPVANLQETLNRREKERVQDLHREQKRERMISAAVATAAMALICLLLSLIVSMAPRPNPPQITASVAPAETEDKLENKRITRPKTNQPVSSSSASSIDFLSTTATSPVAMQSLEISSFDTGLGGMDMGMDLGSSMSFGSVGGESVSFMGTSTSRNMAVVFDITNSMKEALPVVVKEIRRAFKDAQVVCVFGGSFKRGDQKPALIPYKENNPVLGLVKKYSKESAEGFNKPLFSLKRCDSIEYKGRGPEFRQSLGSGIEGLLRQSNPPQTIFVFSDFQDGSSPDYMEEVQSLARRKGCKVVFWYPFDEKRPRWQAVRDLYVDFAKATKGEVKEEAL